MSTYTMFCLPLLSEQFALAMPGAMLTMMREEPGMELSDGLIGAMFAAGSGLNALGKFVGGPVIDSYGPRYFLGVTMPAMALAAFVFGMPSTLVLWPCLGFIILQLCAAGGFLSATKIIEHNFPQEHWSHCFAILGICSRIGSVGSKLGLGALLTFASWREIAKFTSVLVVGSWLMVMNILPVDDAALEKKDLKNNCTIGKATEDEDAKGKHHSTGVFDHTMLSALLNPLALILHPGMALYCCVAAGAYCQGAAFENLSLLILRDKTPLGGAGVAMVAATFPAGLGMALVTAAPLYAKLELRSQKFAFELLLQSISFGALLILAFCVSQAHANSYIIVICLFAVAYGIGLTYYVTINVFPLTFGKNCATAAAILDITGLLSSMFFQWWVGSVLETGGSWTRIVLSLAVMSLVGIACNYALYLHPSLTPHMSCKFESVLDGERDATNEELQTIIGQGSRI